MLLAERRRRRTEPGQAGGHGGRMNFSACPSASSRTLKLGFLIRAAPTFQNNAAVVCVIQSEIITLTRSL